ncbi:MAG: pyridoxamine 5'-phosphate oxidase family protein [Alphaproteobacteria bacterium]|nr:pyridoxamine 5'-phosphate oxidase family protein [Alphaproteobacteria bacterium]
MQQTSEADPYVIGSEEELRSLFPAQHSLAVQKCLGSLDRHSRHFIGMSPFVVVGTRDADGRSDVSPRGDPPGFVKVLDDQTLAIPDRPGNNRLDTMANLLSDSSIGLLFLIPGFDDTLRVNGSARLTRDPDLLASMEVSGKRPKLAIKVTVSEVFLHCAKAFRRSKLWDPEAHQDRSAMPSLAKIILDQTVGAPKEAAEMKRIDDDLEEEYGKTMY